MSKLSLSVTCPFTCDVLSDILLCTVNVEEPLISCFTQKLSVSSLFLTGLGLLFSESKVSSTSSILHACNQRAQHAQHPNSGSSAPTVLPKPLLPVSLPFHLAKDSLSTPCSPTMYAHRERAPCSLRPTYFYSCPSFAIFATSSPSGNACTQYLLASSCRRVKSSRPRSSLPVPHDSGTTKLTHTITNSVANPRNGKLHLNTQQPLLL